MFGVCDGVGELEWEKVGFDIYNSLCWFVCFLVDNVIKFFFYLLCV